MDRLYRDQALVQFYDLDNPWGDDLEYCAGLAQSACSVLDLGCGTGRLIASLATDRQAVGVDPAGAMLEVARTRPGGAQATWVEADARTVRLDRRFDLVVLTGHAFQVFLDEEGQRAVLWTVAAHLAPDGRFIFDSRNPACEEWREWTPQESRRTLRHPRLGTVAAWNDAARDPASGIVTYETHYLVEATGETVSAASQIAFPPRETIDRLLRACGLEADRWLGDWHGSGWSERSPEIIPLGRLA